MTAAEAKRVLRGHQQNETKSKSPGRGNCEFLCNSNQVVRALTNKRCAKYSHVAEEGQREEWFRRQLGLEDDKDDQDDTPTHQHSCYLAGLPGLKPKGV